MDGASGTWLAADREATRAVAGARPGCPDPPV